MCLAVHAPNRYSPRPPEENDAPAGGLQATRRLLRGPRLHWLYRVALIAAGGLLLALLSTAWRLQPASAGFGTHQQLGLPPCTIVSLFGIRCPSCGMTTSWAYFVRGELLQALQANVGGALLAALALTSGPWLLLSGLAGRWWFRTPSDWNVIATSLLVLTATLIDWSVRLWLG